MKWVDVSTYSQSDKERLPKALSAQAGKLKIVLHRHFHYEPDDWLLTAEPFFDKKVLKSKDVNDAKKECENLIVNELQKTLSKIIN